jgi:cob(I)alamin adenosyltransferase
MAARNRGSTRGRCYDAPVKVYTRTGDGGETSLLSGGRVAKDHPRIEAYGTVDELNSVLGLLLTEELPAEAVERLRAAQSSLFSVGASLADSEGRLLPAVEAFSAEPLEGWIDAMDLELDELRSFIVPGGCRAAALAHVARTVCRRAERRVMAVDPVDDAIVPFLNRLSDALFVLARFLNHRQGIADPEWRGGR